MSAPDDAPSSGVRPGQDTAHGASGAPSREGTTPVSTPSQPGSAPHGSFHKTRTSCNPATTAIHCNNRFADIVKAGQGNTSANDTAGQQPTATSPLGATLANLRKGGQKDKRPGKGPQPQQQRADIPSAAPSCPTPPPVPPDPGVAASLQSALDEASKRESVLKLRLDESDKYVLNLTEQTSELTQLVRDKTAKLHAAETAVDSDIVELKRIVEAKAEDADFLRVRLRDTKNARASPR